ncbi:MAG TPA: hypothetical protein VLF93_06220 [Candidatus Saccharimonadales bacterium]|nr:hypothetical protein [Candidatus Saccharimonadales bacterium]
MKHILIASSRFDCFTTKLVKRLLVKKGYTVTIFEADRVAQGLDQFSISITKTGKIEVMYKGVIHDLSEITAAWYRRPNIFTDNNEYSAEEESLATQYRGIQRYLWDSIPEKVWLNSYRNINNANSKLEQLLVAQKLGFTIPQTIIANKWEKLKELSGEKIILKLIDGLIYTREGTKFLYTKIVPKTNSSLHLETLPYPGIWQPYIEKKREWRITVVGKQVFSTAVYTHALAKDDWRVHQFKKDHVQFKAETFPITLQKKCLQYLKHYRLRFGAFDFIETPEGEIVFLELNPNGQYGWLEDELKMPISQAIAAELENIAEGNK